jgi:uncharacterized membrane protein
MADPTPSKAVSGRTRTLVIFVQRLIFALSKHWFWLAMAVPIIFLFLGLLAPALMAEGNRTAGQRIYAILRLHNHQLPQRSYFLFAESGGIQTYSKEQLLTFGADANDLETFLGNDDIGYKMALNHRMTAIFIGILVGALYWGFRRGRPQLKFIPFIMLSLPLLIDGFSHLISETNGTGFRASNAWAVTLTGNVFSPAFYEGTTVGSLNWWLRTLTGLIFGLGISWFLFTWFADYFRDIRSRLEPRLRRIGVIQ